MPQSQQTYLVDGQMDFSAGVDSGKVPLLASPSNPNGLTAQQLAWLNNGTVRGGAITQRGGWAFLNLVPNPTGGPYQGGYLYEPTDGSEPYLILSIAGDIWKLGTRPGDLAVNLTSGFGVGHNPGWPNDNTYDKAYFCQGEEFLVIQAGDYGKVAPGAEAKPLFWDGNTLRRSHGLLGIAPQNIDPHNGGFAANCNEIPPALQMDYYMHRFWYAQIRLTSAGDIVGGPSGSPAYNLRDSILRVTESPLAIGGDGFAIPTSSGPIRALAHSAAIDTALGQAQLFIFTRRDIHALAVPVTRADWTTTTEPLQRVVQLKYGTSADRSVVAVNGDLFYQTMEPGIRTLALAIRYFNQWANTPISRNINRVLDFNDRALSRFGSGMLFDNRLWETCLPYVSSFGVAHKAIAMLDFDLISSFQDKLAGAPIPAWEGIVQGLAIYDIFSGDFGGLERAVAVHEASANAPEGPGLELWELTSEERFDLRWANFPNLPPVYEETQVEWQMETPAYPFSDPFQLKELQAGELWIDTLWSTVDFLVEYRADDDPCWHFWAQFSQCSARNSLEDVQNPISYPLTDYREGNRKPLTLPHPPLKECMGNGRGPAFIGYFFQIRITIKGFCRVRGVLLYATKAERALYDRLVC